MAAVTLDKVFKKGELVHSLEEVEARIDEIRRKLNANGNFEEDDDDLKWLAKMANNDLEYTSFVSIDIDEFAKLSVKDQLEAFDNYGKVFDSQKQNACRLIDCIYTSLPKTVAQRLTDKIMDIDMEAPKRIICATVSQALSDIYKAHNALYNGNYKEAVLPELLTEYLINLAVENMLEVKKIDIINKMNELYKVDNDGDYIIKDPSDLIDWFCKDVLNLSVTETSIHKAKVKNDIIDKKMHNILSKKRYHEWSDEAYTFFRDPSKSSYYQFMAAAIHRDGDGSDAEIRAFAEKMIKHVEEMAEKEGAPAENSFMI